MRLWNVRTGYQVAVLRGHDDNVNSAAFSPDGNYIASASDDFTTRVWDVSLLRSMDRDGGSDPPVEIQIMNADLHPIAEDSVDELDSDE